ncbi:putative mitochondrial protein [Fagus crenata]
MRLTLYLGVKRENIACHKSKARFGTLLRKGCLTSQASRDEAFWRSQVNFRPPNPATDEKALWSKRKRVRCHTLCLPKVPRGRERTLIELFHA